MIVAQDYFLWIIIWLLSDCIFSTHGKIERDWKQKFSLENVKTRKE